MQKSGAYAGLAFAAIACAFGAGDAAAAPCAPPATTAATRTVTRVIDAETLSLDNGTEIRLAGVLAPHAPAAAEASQWPLEDEARRTLETAAEGHAISAAIDPTRERDRYGRTIAQVYVVEGERTIWLQGLLLDAGLARVSTRSGSVLCDAAMREREAVARDAKRGLWASPAYRILAADDTRELYAHTGDFVLVEGRVEAVAAKSRRLYLNFGSDWRRDFTISIPPAVVKREPDAVQKLRAAAGKPMRVRGWIERRNGPLIEVTSAADVEILSPTNEQRPAEAQPGVVESSKP